MAFPPMAYPHPPHACRRPAASDLLQLQLSSTWDRIYYLWIRICYCRTRSWFHLKLEEFFGPLATHSSPFTHSTHSLLLDGQEEIASVSRPLSLSRHVTNNDLGVEFGPHYVLLCTALIIIRGRNTTPTSTHPSPSPSSPPHHPHHLHHHQPGEKHTRHHLPLSSPGQTGEQIAVRAPPYM